MNHFNVRNFRASIEPTIPVTVPATVGYAWMLAADF
jgi:hypothetical protein